MRARDELFVVALILTTLVVIVGVLQGGRFAFAAYIDPGSLLIVVWLTAGAIILRFGTSARTAIQTLGDKEASAEMLEVSVRVFRNAKSCALGSGVVGTLTGMRVMLQGMESNSTPYEALSRGLGLALLSQAYGVFLAYGVCFPIMHWLRCRLERTL